MAYIPRRIHSQNFLNTTKRGSVLKWTRNTQHKCWVITGSKVYNLSPIYLARNGSGKWLLVTATHTLADFSCSNKRMVRLWLYENA